MGLLRQAGCRIAILLLDELPGGNSMECRGWRVGVGGFHRDTRPPRDDPFPTQPCPEDKSFCSPLASANCMRDRQGLPGSSPDLGVHYRGAQSICRQPLVAHNGDEDVQRVSQRLLRAHSRALQAGKEGPGSQPAGQRGRRAASWREPPRLRDRAAWYRRC